MQLRTKDAKSKFDVLVREVEEKQKTVTLFDRGKPVAQIIPTDVTSTPSESSYRVKTIGETLKQ